AGCQRSGLSSCTSTGAAVGSCRSERGTSEEPTHRLAAGNAGPADPEDSGAGAAARLGDFRAGAADFERRAARAAGLALSGAAPAGAARVDQSALGNFREQPAREVLRADRGGEKAAR